MMKNILRNIMIALTVVGIFSSCSDEKLGEGEGRLQLKVSVNGETKVVSKATTEASLAESCVVYIYSSQGLVRKYKGTNEVPESIWLVSGAYRVTGTAGDSVPASFDNQYYKGMAIFNITKDQTAQVDLTCKIANVVTAVNFGNIGEGLKDYKMTISSSTGELEFTSENATASGYFMMDDGDKDLTWTLSGTQIVGGEAYEKTGTIENVKAATKYTLNLNYTEQQSNNGGAIFEITIAETPIEDKEVELTAAPKFMLNGGRDNIDAPILFQPNGFVGTLGVYATAACRMQSVSVNSNGLFTTIGLPYNSFEVVALTETQLEAFAAKGLTITNKYDAAQDNTIIKLSFSQELMNKITVGEYHIDFVATDVNGKVRNYRMTIKVADAWALTTAVDEADTYTNRTVLRASLLNTNAKNIAFNYRVKDTETWTKTGAASVNGNNITFALTGLTPNTTYEYQVVYQNTASEEMSGDIMEFKTEDAAQLPNAGFEVWDVTSSPYIIGPHANREPSFWDSGNHGSATLNKNVTVRSTTRHSGDFSVDLQSQFVSLFGVGKFAAGNVFAGKYLATNGTNGVIGFGRPWGSRPTKLKGWVKYVPQTINRNAGAVEGATGLDKGQIYIALWDEDRQEYNGQKYPWIVNSADQSTFFNTNSPHIIAYGQITYTAATQGEGLIPFEITLDYRSNKKATAIVLVASASYYGDYFCGGDGSEMWLDDLELVYE